MHRVAPLLLTATLLGCELSETGTGQQNLDAAFDVMLDGPSGDAGPDEDAPIDAPIDSSDADANDAGPPATPPTAVSGCVAWYRADMGVTNDAGVSAWADESNGDITHLATQTVGTAQPTLNPSDGSYNGHPTLSFAAAQSQALRTATWSTPLAQPYTVMVVGEQTAGAFVDGTSGTAQGRLFTDGSSYTGFWAGSSLFITTKRMTTPSAALVVVDGSSSRLYLSSLTPTSGTVGPAAPDGVAIGSDWYGTSQLQGKVAEIAYFSRAINPSEVSGLFAYVGGRYSIPIGP